MLALQGHGMTKYTSIRLVFARFPANIGADYRTSEDVIVRSEV